MPQPDVQLQEGYQGLPLIASSQNLAGDSSDKRLMPSRGIVR